MTEARDETAVDAVEVVEAVGYCRPPVAHRFKPGQSGNPKGRPRGKRGLATLMAMVMGEKIPVTIKGRKRKITVDLAILLRMREQALAGDQKATRLLLDLYKTYGAQDEGPMVDSAALAEEDRMILARYLGHAEKETGDG